jgi:hypothetical protein
MNDPRQDRLWRFLERHDVSPRCGARLVSMRLAAKWNTPAPDVIAVVDPESINWHALNPPWTLSTTFSPRPGVSSHVTT